MPRWLLWCVSFLKYFARRPWFEFFLGQGCAKAAPTSNVSPAVGTESPLGESVAGGSQAPRCEAIPNEDGQLLIAGMLDAMEQFDQTGIEDVILGQQQRAFVA